MGWHVARSRPGREAEAAAAILAAGLYPFYPKQRTYFVIKGKRRHKDSALYPSYVFAKGELTPENWHQACSDKHVVGFIGVTHDDKGVLRDDLDEEGVLIPRLESPIEVFKRGQLLRILTGPFTGHIAQCIFTGADANIRVALKSPLLGRKIELYLTPDALSATINNKPDNPRRRSKYGHSVRRAKL